MLPRQSRYIFTGFILVIGLMIALSITALSRMQQMQNKLNNLTDQHNVKTKIMNSIRKGIYNRQISLRNMMLMESPFDRDLEAEKFRKYALDVYTAREELAQMSLSRSESDTLNKIHRAMRQGYNFQSEILDKVIFSESRAEYQPLLREAFNKQTIIVDLLEVMSSIIETNAAAAVLDAENAYSDAKQQIYILGTIALIMALVIMGFVIKGTNLQTRKLEDALSKLRESNDLLEFRVEERTRELAIARDEAMASNQTKSTFLTNMSHELRTPMNAIIGYSELLEEIATDDHNEAFIPDLKRIQCSAKHLLSLINEILDLSKIDAGKMELDPTVININSLLHEVDATIRPLIKLNNNFFRISCDDNIGNMLIDSMRLRQILVNIIGNATKFTSNGTIQLKAFRSTSRGASWVNFVISDTGIGIEQEYLDRLFDDFSQADSSTTKQYGGTGLGLSISKRLCTLMNGDISVTSELGKGSIFTIRLPGANYQISENEVISHVG